MNITIESLIQVISKSVKIDPSEISEGVSLTEDLGIDSVETIELCKDLNDHFNCQLSVTDIREAQDVKSLAQKISQIRLT